jgi:hypothetical protein
MGEDDHQHVEQALAYQICYEISAPYMTGYRYKDNEIDDGGIEIAVSIVLQQDMQVQSYCFKGTM